MMFAHTPTSLYALRFLPGVCEAGFYPGVLRSCISRTGFLQSSAPAQRGFSISGCLSRS
jgi:hypothetical protein